MNANGHGQSEPLPHDALTVLCEVSRAILGIADFDGHLRWVNQAYVDAFGHSREELLAMPSYLDMVHADDLEAVISLLSSLEADAEGPPVEVRVRHSDGSWRWFRSSTTVVEELVYFSGIDVTEEREHRERLLHANQLLSLFGVGVAHDLRSLCALIEGASAHLITLLKADEPDVGLIETLGHMLGRNVSRTRTFLGALQAVTRGEPVDRRVVALQDVVADAAQDVSADREAAGASIAWDESMPDVWVSPVLVRAALANLFANSIRFGGDEGAEIVVAASATTDGVTVSVTDGGPGLGADDLATIFDSPDTPGTPSDPTPEASELRRVPSGYGLGLALCRRVVDAHGGRVWAISSPGGGTTLTMEFPAGPPADP